MEVVIKHNRQMEMTLWALPQPMTAADLFTILILCVSVTVFEYGFYSGMRSDPSKADVCSTAEQRWQAVSKEVPNTK